MAVVALIALAFTFDGLYARDNRVELVAMRLEQKIVRDDYRYIRERIWRLEDAYKCLGEENCYTIMPEPIWIEYRDLCADRKELEKEMEIFKGGQ